MDFSPDGRYLALLEFVHGKDFLSILDSRDPQWARVVRLEVSTRYADGLKWSPDGRHIVIWDTELYDKVAIVSADGRLLHTHAMQSLSAGTSDENNRYRLNIRTVEWAPSSQLLFICGYDLPTYYKLV